MGAVPDNETPQTRKWVRTIGESLAKAANIDNPDGLSFLLAFFLLKGVTGFFTPKKSQAESGDGFDHLLDKFDTDPCIFEVFCYIFFQLDLWLLRNGHDQFRVKVFNGPVVSLCIDLFKMVLSNQELDNVLNNRLRTYAEVLDAATSTERRIERHRFYFCQFLYRTNLAKSPKVYDVKENFHLIVTGFTEEYAVGANLSAYLVGMLPAHIANLKTAIERSTFS